MKPNPTHSNSKKNIPHEKHNNQIRIIGGTLRGRKITFGNASGLRPTPDSVRERLFNWLGQDLTGQTVLDLFSGSGALAFESVSRHAKRVDLCEINRQTIQNIRQHAQQFGVTDKIQIHAQDGIQFLAQSAQKQEVGYDLVLLDPPFAWNDWGVLFEHLKGCLNDGAYIYLEAGNLPEIPDYLAIYRNGKAGQSQFLLLSYEMGD